MIFLIIVGLFLGLMAASWTMGMIGHTHPFQCMPLAKLIVWIGFPIAGAVLVVQWCLPAVIFFKGIWGKK